MVAMTMIARPFHAPCLPEEVSWLKQNSGVGSPFTDRHGPGFIKCDNAFWAEPLQGPEGIE
eukprot:4545536-Pyramimonas_sp.AAC.1